MTIKKIYSATILLLISIASSMTSAAQGLGFHGMDCRIDKRTSFNVFGDHPQTFENDLKIDFELYTQPLAEFGYFFRLKDESNSRRIWNISYDSRGDSIVVRLNEEGRQSLIKANVSHNALKPLHWHKVRIEFDLLRDSVKLDIAGEKFNAYFQGLPDKVCTSVVFGRSDHIIDVPSFAIRDLTIGNSTKSFHFPLDNTEGNIVCDDSYHVEGHVENPEWLINNAMKWKECGALSYDDIAGACYNPKRKEFYYFTNTQMTVLNLMNGQKGSYLFDPPCPIEMKLGNNYISADGDHLICYELYNDEVPKGSPSVASLDLDSRRWTTLSHEQLYMPMHHHSGFINPSSGEYVVFGGFGNMLYNGDFFEFDPVTGKWGEIWHDIKGEHIYPRYFTSSGTDGQYIYIYGGMGNECGEQVVGRRYFYDLHRIDPKTGECRHMWSLERPESDKVPVRNLIVDEDYLYSLCYPEYISKSELYLYRMSIENGTAEKICTSIPIVSDKMRTNANIYLDKDLSQFFATVQEFEDDIKSTLKIYSLSYPPVTDKKNLSDREKHLRVMVTRYGWLYGILAFLLAVSCTATILMIRKNRKKRRTEKENRSGKKLFCSETRPDSIYIFGDLTITGHDGRDITHLFTSQQSLILCLLIKRGDNGISTKRLSSILWPDKEEEKVKNSRGVAINNLRKSLSNLNGATVAYRDSRYYLEMGEESQCDYFLLMDDLKNKNMDKSKILGIISRGKFLKSLDDDIFDDFKEDTDNIIVSLLHNELEDRLKKKDYEAIYEIGEMARRIDPLDELALEITIKALKKQKRVEEALVLYSTFCSEYKKVNDADFNVAFKNY